jgi:Holliday junction resolvase RusA-like endonuclease
VTHIVSFFIHGTPRPGGSKTACPLYRRGGGLVMVGNRPIIRMVDDAKGNAQWKKVVATAASKHYTAEPLTGALDVTFEFWMPRPKGHYRTGRNASLLRPNAPQYPTVKPDVLKLSRSTEDALTGIVWVDDCTTVDLTTRKRYAPGLESVGCRVMVSRMADPAMLRVNGGAMAGVTNG